MSEDPQNGDAAQGQISAEISNAIVRITREYTGRGPTQARTVIDGDWVFVTLVDALTKGEKQLVASGQADCVRSIRRTYQDVMRKDMSGAVKRLTGRKVVAFLSDSSMDPDVSIEAFALERIAEAA